MHDATPLERRIRQVRDATTALTRELSAEDCMVQSAPFASPIKWHLAHTTWFFEELVLGAHAGEPPHEPAWAALFNSYYEARVRHHRPRPPPKTAPSS